MGYGVINGLPSTITDNGRFPTMDIRTTAGLIDRLFLPDTGQKPQANTETTKTRGQDLIRLSREGHNKNNQNEVLRQNQTRLISENTEEIKDGFRRTQKFAGKDGRSFTRVEEFTSTPKRAIRIVIQQNGSGSTTVAENILDRQKDETFRLTQRYTDEVGETATNIEFNVAPKNVDILLGRPPSSAHNPDTPFPQTRGTQFDVVT